MPSSDKIIFRIVDDVSRYSRDKYERILVECGLYDLNQLHNPDEGYTKILSKKEFILTTLEEKGFEPLINHLIENGMLSPETIKLLDEDGYDTFEGQKKTSAAQNNSFETNSKISASDKPKTSSTKAIIPNNSSKVLKRNSLNWKVPTAIIVAIIGCAGTFISALFGYLAIKSQIEIPIRTTQTADALQKDLTANAPEKPTQVTFTSTPTIDWSAVLKGSTTFLAPCGVRVVPDHVSLDPKNMQSSLANFNSEFSKSHEGNDWDVGHGTVLTFYLESYSQLNWIKVENRFNLNIYVDSEIPDNVNIVSIAGCGGGAWQPLGNVELINQANMREYRISLNYPDVDFYTLQPGEFEVFSINLECKAPGIYSFAIETYAKYLSSVHNVIRKTQSESLKSA